MRSICVIGAGISGLCTTKELLEKNINVSCYEASSSIGGTFSGKLKKGGVYDGLYLTVSNFFMAFSSHPINNSEPRRYWSANEFLDYLRSYAERFNLDKHVQLNSRILKVEKNQNTYSVTIQTHDNETFTKSFDGVVVCTGTNRIPRIPKIPGIEQFNGKVLHTVDYKSNNEFTNQRVLCVGAGESGADIAANIAKVSSTCTLNMKSIPSVVPRWINRDTNDAFTSLAFSSMGTEGMNIFMRIKSKFMLRNRDSINQQEKIRYEWILKSPGYFNRFLTKNDDFLTQITNGKIKSKHSEISHIDGNKVYFSDGSCDSYDTIILNTGYKEDFEYLTPSLRPNSFRDLYKHMINPEIGESLAFIGWARPAQGGVPACAEMQARYLALLYSGQLSLPEKVQLNKIVMAEKHFEESFFSLMKELTSLVDYHQFMLSMARLIGCEPKINPFFSPILAYRHWFGSHLSNFYRLNGEGANRKESLNTITKLPVSSGLIRNMSIVFISLFAKFFQYRQKRNNVVLN